MVQAWKIIKFMTGDLPGNVLEALVQAKTRVTVMARYEGTTNVPDGKHNRLNSRKELKKYDPDLYQLIHLYFSEFENSTSKHSTKNLYKI